MVDYATVGVSRTTKTHTHTHLQGENNTSRFQRFNVIEYIVHMYLCSRCCYSWPRGVQCERTRRGKGRPRPGWRCNTWQCIAQAVDCHSLSLGQKHVIIHKIMISTNLCFLTFIAGVPSNKGHIFLQHVIPPWPVNCPTDTSRKKRGIPQVSSIKA